jgi:hypothetical protein
MSSARDRVVLRVRVGVGVISSQQDQQGSSVSIERLSSLSYMTSISDSVDHQSPAITTFYKPSIGELR